MAPVLFVYVPEVKVEIRHRGLTGIAHNFHVLDDCGTRKRQTTSVTFLEIENMAGQPKNRLA